MSPRGALGVGLLSVGLLSAAVAAAACNDVAADKVVGAEPACPQVRTDSGAWESGPWRGDDACPWLSYPGKTALEIPHDLGYEPSAVLPYVSFARTGEEATLGAGDVARVIDVNDETVTVGNATNQKLFLRVVLR